MGLDAEAIVVSTHSRPKAAGWAASHIGDHENVSTHSRPKAAGQKLKPLRRIIQVSTHSRPKAAGFLI